MRTTGRLPLLEMDMRHKKLMLVPWLLAALLLVGCGPKPTPPPDTEQSADFFAMDTFMSFRFYGGDETLAHQLQTAVKDMESELSVVGEDSAVYQLNHTGSTHLSDTGADLLRQALALCNETDGALDISVYPVVRAWGFTGAAPEEGSARIPAPETLQRLLERVNYRQIRLEGNDVSLPEGMEIDLGSVAKGYAGDMLARMLKDAGVESAVLALGGNIQTVGSRPDGGAWRVGVQSPDKDGLLGVLSVSDRAVVTSGGYERFFTDDDGNIWWHIMDPSTGYPAQSGLVSVTVIGPNGLTCDALSTALFVMGPEKAEDFWRAHRDFEMILATEDGRLLLTPEAAGAFEADKNLSYAVEVIGND